MTASQHPYDLTDHLPRLHAPPGGVRIAGRFYKAGQILPKRYWRASSRLAHNGAVDRSDSNRSSSEWARDLVPQILTFAGRSSGIGQVYRSADQALRESVENARFMRNDAAIMECLEARQRAVALLPWRIEAEDNRDPVQRRLVSEMTELLRRLPQFTEYRRNLLEALWYGRYACQHLFGWEVVNGRRQVAIQGWKPINGDKLVFRWDDGSGRHADGQIGIRVSSGYAAGQMLDGRLVEHTEQGLAYFLQPWERCRLAVHRHVIEDGSYEDVLSAGRLHGVGIRDRIYWSWFQKQESMAQLMEVIERTGTGFTIYYYPAGNPHAKAEVRELAERQTRTNVVLMPRLPGDPAAEAFGIERIEPSTAGIDALKQIVHDFFNHQIKRFILGQTLSSESAATGLGSGVADLHQNTFAQIVEYDAIKLAETLTQETLVPLKNFNFSKLRDIPLHLRLITKPEDAEKKLRLYKTAWDMGLKINAQDILQAIGATAPEPGDEVLCHPNFASPEEPTSESAKAEFSRTSTQPDIQRRLDRRSLTSDSRTTPSEEPAARERYYRRDQRRVPAGSPKGGQFVEEGEDNGGGAGEDSPDQMSHDSKKGESEPAQRIPKRLVDRFDSKLMKDMLNKDVPEPDYQRAYEEARRHEVDSEILRTQKALETIPVRPADPPHRSLIRDMLKTPVPKRATTEEKLAAFERGFTQGFWQDGVVGTISEIGSTIWWLAKRTARMAINPIATVWGDLKSAKEAFHKYGPGAATLWELEKLGPLGRHFLTRGEYEKIADRVSPETIAAFEMARDLIDETMVALKEKVTDEKEFAELEGRLTGIITYEVAEGFATASAAKVLKTGALSKYLVKIGEMIDKSDEEVLLKRFESLAENVAELVKTRQCFVAGTLIHTADGLRPIESIRAGDYVLTRSAQGPWNASPVLNRVAHTFVTKSIVLCHVTLRTPSGQEETIVGTPNHPFFSIADGKFVEAGELLVGDAVTGPSGEVAYIDRLRIEYATDGSTYTTYNIEVEDEHTYFVGRLGIWVHNSSRIECLRAARKYKKAYKQALETSKDAKRAVEEGVQASLGHLSDKFKQARLSREEYIGHLSDTLQELRKNGAITDVKAKALLQRETDRLKQIEIESAPGSWKRPPNWRLPKNGKWSGIEGHSHFIPDNPQALGVPPGTRIPFQNGYPDFSGWASDIFDVPKLNGLHHHDMPRIHAELARRKGWLKSNGSPNASRAERWLQENRLTPHHSGGNGIQLVPYDLHNGVRHTGGAWELRNSSNVK